MATLTSGYAACMALSAFPTPDPSEGFSAGTEAGTVSTSGVLHLLLGQSDSLLSQPRHSRAPGDEQRTGSTA
jgi:hypothetical protein